MATRRESVRVEASGQMHRDAFDGLTDAEAAPLLAEANSGKVPARKTVNDWRNGGRGGIPDSVATYALSAPHPWRVSGEMDALLKQQIVRPKDDAALIEDYWLLRQKEPQVEADDRAFDSARPDSWTWMERAAARKRDVAVNAELAAHEMELAARGLTWAEVVAGRPS